MKANISIRSDIIENESDFTVKAEVPGLSKNDIKINIDASNRVLTIKGERKHEMEFDDSDHSVPSVESVHSTDNKDAKHSLPTEKKDVKSEDNSKVDSKVDSKADSSVKVDGKQSKPYYFRRFERSYGSVSRSFRLPPNIDTSKVTAKHENGVLTIIVPKKATPQTQQITIS